MQLCNSCDAVTIAHMQCISVRKQLQFCNSWEQATVGDGKLADEKDVRSATLVAWKDDIGRPTNTPITNLRNRLRPTRSLLKNDDP